MDEALRSGTLGNHSKLSFRFQWRGEMRQKRLWATRPCEFQFQDLLDPNSAKKALEVTRLWFSQTHIRSIVFTRPCSAWHDSIDRSSGRCLVAGTSGIWCHSAAEAKAQPVLKSQVLPQPPSQWRLGEPSWRWWRVLKTYPFFLGDMGNYDAFQISSMCFFFM